MKKIHILYLMMLASVIASAQYKKASFLTKSGRTYSLGTTVHVMGDGKGAPIGFYFSGGRDNTESHFFTWYEFVGIPPFKYSFQTTAYNYSTQAEEPVTVSGKSKFHLIYNYNVGYHILNRDGGSEQKLQPYVFLGINAVLLGRANQPEVYNQYTDLKRNVTTEGLSFGARGGVGAVYNITDRIGVKTDLGYNFQYNFESDGYNTEMYNMFTNHILITAGVRFRFLED